MRQVTIITNPEMLKLIKRHMKSKGLTIAAQAREIGVNYQYFLEMLTGRWPVTDQVARYSSSSDSIRCLLSASPARSANHAREPINRLTRSSG